MNPLHKYLLLSACVAVPALVQAADFVVRDIRVEGLQRISAGTVFNYLPVSVGSTVRQEDFPELIRALFRTGFFTDVSLERDGNVLVVNVVERPAISEVTISGNKDISTEDLQKSLKAIGLSEGRVFDRALLDKVEQELNRQYFARGKYAVKIDTQVKNLDRNRVALNIDISEGLAARIKQINIVGNRAFDEDDLLALFQSSTTGWLSLLTKDDQYSRQKLGGDLEALRSFYQDQGYLKFAVESTQVSITPDKKDIYITVNITEGERYTIKSIALSGELLVPRPELEALITLKPGDEFSRSALNATTKAITDRIGDEGYAFANVNVVPQIDETTKQVAVNLIVDPGKRVYVRRINFKGNVKTQDDVLRREMRQTEGSWFSTRDVTRSKERLERLSFVQEATVETPAVPGSGDQVDVNFGITERPAGSLSFGIGYGQDAGVLLNASVTQNNFMGTGNQVSATFNNSQINTIYSFSFIDPYFTADGVSAGIRGAYRETDATEANLANYLTNEYSVLGTLGFPLNETDFINVNFGWSGIKIKTNGSETPIEIYDYIAQNGDKNEGPRVEVSWARDSRNRTVFADQGSYNRVGLESQLPGSDQPWYKLTYRNSTYFPLTKSLTLLGHFDLGYGDGMGSADGLPFYENFYAGGLRTVRGYKTNTLGPKWSNDDPRGGALRTAGGIEVLFPVPFIKDPKNVRLSAFVDAGNVYEDYNSFDASELRYSAGLSVQWITPLGPLVMSLAQPLNKKDGDKSQPFQFTFGVPF
ncbi:Beta-barrel assembly machine subunit BamA [Plasticicumulans lactativorans]|uniref:Outer membrane protein assembly factor BamA n=1 Tax=Plasticicumulans lactativorans TaxID=1133106 RepID=A0A4R2LBI4_9GAMM|nr:outer membrane protein assembly factor BamA [Plasticicumulans lactativorans]TCO83717.1 Beta-barrel assembly machine subunit BamA [Plasticicumulans lactativorans]